MSDLDIGANDGKTFSNSLRLIENGWKAVLVEPSPRAFKRLSELHALSDNVHCVNVAIANSNGMLTLKESSSLINENDIALVSSLKPEETTKWTMCNFKDVNVVALDFQTFYSNLPIKKFDFISIDVEGFDYDVLKQIDLNLVGCRCLCVEFNGKNKDLFVNYVSKFGMNLISQNYENLIFAK